MNKPTLLASLVVIGLLLLLVAAWRGAEPLQSTESMLGPGVADSGGPGGSALVLPLPEAEERVMERPQAMDSDVRPGQDPSAGSEVEATPDSRPGALVVRMNGADPRGAVCTIQGGTGMFMGGEIIPERSQTRPMEPLAGLGGEANFEGLPIQSWSVEIVEANGRMHRTYVSLKKNNPRSTVTLAFGAGVVEGTIWQEDGHPWSGVAVTVTTEARAEGPSAENESKPRPWRTWTTTDEHGQYRIGEIVSSTGRYLFQEPGSFAIGDGTGRPIANGRFAITGAEVRTFNHGSSAGLVHAKVQVRDATGYPVRSGSVNFYPVDERTPSQDHSGTPNEGAAGDLDDEGKAEVKLRPGAYSVMVWGPDGPHPRIAGVQVVGLATNELAFQLKSGHSIHGTVLGPDGAPLTDQFSMGAIALRREPRGKEVELTTLQSDGTFAFHAVENGEYFVTMGADEALAYSTVSVVGAEPTAFKVTLSLP